jgi:FkbM family methyltransferase
LAAAFPLLLLAACGGGESQTDFDDLLANGKALYAEGRSELVIRHFFRDRENGFYVDIGAFEPKKLSTTYYLEGHLGWTGIAVDAIAELADAWERERPQSKFFAYAVTDKSGETITFYEYGGISSTDKGNIETWEKKAKRDLKERKIVVPTITIDDLLEREGVEKIDFLSMDINGTEPTALRGFDIEKYRPDLVHIEVHEENRLVIRKWFEDRGYERVDEYLPYEIINWYFKPRGS